MKRELSRARAIALGVLGWLAAITSLHLWLNVDTTAWRNRRLPVERRKLEVGYIPVT